MKERKQHRPRDETKPSPRADQVAVADGLILSGCLSLTVGIGLILGVGALLVSFGVCCCVIGVLVAKSANGGRRNDS